MNLTEHTIDRIKNILISKGFEQNEDIFSKNELNILINNKTCKNIPTSIVCDDRLLFIYVKNICGLADFTLENFKNVSQVYCEDEKVFEMLSKLISGETNIIRLTHAQYATIITG